MHRRDFLKPAHLAEVLGPLAGTLEPDPEPSAQPVHLRFGRRAMATLFEILLPWGTPNAAALVEAALAEVDRLEAQLTVYNEHSEVSRLNSQAHARALPVEPGLFALLRQARELWQATEGAFDITVGALIKAWGFYRRQGKIPTPARLDAVRKQVGFQHVSLDDAAGTVRLLRRGLEFNLGSIGKGYALDRAAQPLREASPSGLMHGGHSSVLAWGNETAQRPGWRIGLMDPLQTGCRRALVHLRDRALATSAATFQHFEHAGKKLGHLLDPRTLWPAEGVLSATATAPSAAEADALATAFFILGADQTRAYCERHASIGAVLLTQREPQRLQLFGQAAGEVELLR